MNKSREEATFNHVATAVAGGWVRPKGNNSYPNWDELFAQKEIDDGVSTRRRLRKAVDEAVGHNQDLTVRQFVMSMPRIPTRCFDAMMLAILAWREASL